MSQLCHTVWAPSKLTKPVAARKGAAATKQATAFARQVVSGYDTLGTVDAEVAERIAEAMREALAEKLDRKAKRRRKPKETVY
jgi:hypothetical protein